ncbi:MAG: hypothetical protein H6765_05820 [Candidatus Peribacteria bacterium]|nr:MAG: hypothetical protein H6765_05820 [Candidatus Peribacteria bacterium]
MQEYVQKLYKQVPAYEDAPLEVDPSGQVAVYQSQVFVLGKLAGSGTGTSKKRAQEAAAEQAIEAMNIS